MKFAIWAVHMWDQATAFGFKCLWDRPAGDRDVGDCGDCGGEARGKFSHHFCPHSWVVCLGNLLVKLPKTTLCRAPGTGRVSS